MSTTSLWNEKLSSEGENDVRYETVHLLPIDHHGGMTASDDRRDWTAFKKAQVRYRRQPDRPDQLDDLEEFIDFSRASSSTERVECALHGDCYRGPVYRLIGFDGFLYAPAALSTRAQEELAFQAVNTYCERPHSTNIDLVPPKAKEVDNPHESLWQLWKQEEGKQQATKKYRCFQKLSWATLGYNYNWTLRQYQDRDRSPVPEDLERLAKRFASTALHILGAKSTAFDGSAGIVNYYHAKSLMGGHRDDAEYAVDKPIVSFSMGRPAVFLLGGATREDTNIVAILVRPGDVMLMGGATRLNYHAMARLLPHDLPAPEVSRLPSPEQQIDCLDESAAVPEAEKAALRAYLLEHRININLRQVYPDCSPAETTASGLS